MCCQIVYTEYCLYICNPHNSRTIRPTDFKFDTHILHHHRECSARPRLDPIHGCPEPAEKALPLYLMSSHTCPRPVLIDCHGNPSSEAYKQSPTLAANYCQSTVTLSHWQCAVSTHFPQTFTTAQGLFCIGTKGTTGTTGIQ